MASQKGLISSDSDVELSDTPFSLPQLIYLCIPPPLQQPVATKSEEPADDESPSHSFQNTNHEPVAQPVELHHPNN
jgi:hypothetical protein